MSERFNVSDDTTRVVTVTYLTEGVENPDQSTQEEGDSVRGVGWVGWVIRMGHSGFPGPSRKLKVRIPR